MLTKKSVVSFACVVMISLGVWCGNLFAQIPSWERDALIALYNSTGGPNWTNKTNWLGAPGTEGTWYGVGLRATCPPWQGKFPICSFNVSGIGLENNNLNGSIPTQLQSLGNMISLNLAYNHLMGPIPVQLGSLPSLLVLGLSHNQLTGEVPASFINLTTLWNNGGLDLSYNHLQCSDPSLLAFLNSKHPAALGDWLLTQNPPNALVDFNGDWKSDIFWRNSSTGDNKAWLMNWTTFLNDLWFVGMDQRWKAAAFADFNGDGWTDIVWQDPSNDQVMVWYMNGEALPMGADFMFSMGPGWKIVGAGDFNGDGKADLFWRNDSTGNTVVWLLDGITYKDAVWLAPNEQEWRLAAVTDIGPDGFLDLVWQNRRDGVSMVWTMNGEPLPVTASYIPSRGVDWKIVGAGDYNGDGQQDFLWHNSSTGEVSVWLMNGWSLQSEVSLGTMSDPAWKIMGEE